MAKKKTETKTQIIEDVPDGTIPDGTITGVNGGEFSLLDTETVVKVYKLFPGKSKPSICFERNEAVTETELQNLYGGGSYTLEYITPTGKRLEHLEIADKPTHPDSKQPVTIADVQIQMLKEQAQMNRDLLMAVLGRGNVNTPMSEIAQIWGLIHGVNPTNGNGGGIEKFISIFEKGLEIGANKGGDMDWKGALIQTVREIAPTVTNVLAQAKGIQQAPSVVNNVPAVPDQLLRSGVAMLKSKILAGLPVGLALDWIVANANDPQYHPFISLALSKSFEELVQIDNELVNEPFNSWTRQFLDGLKEHFKQTSSVDVEEQEQ